MKKLIIIFFGVVSTSLIAQTNDINFYEAPSVRVKKKKNNYSFKRILPSLIASSFSGYMSGSADMLLFKYDQTIFPKDNGKFLGMTEQYWNPEISHTNKWKHGKMENGEKFFLSSTALVSLTDGWHMADFLERTSNQSLIFVYQPPKKDKHYLKKKIIDFILIKAAYSISWHVAEKTLLER